MMMRQKKSIHEFDSAGGNDKTDGRRWNVRSRPIFHAETADVMSAWRWTTQPLTLLWRRLYQTWSVA